MPPLAKWSDMKDGTLTLEDVAQMHAVMKSINDRSRMG